MKTGDLVREAMDGDVGIIVSCPDEYNDFIIVFSTKDQQEQIWSPNHTEVISEGR